MNFFASHSSYKIKSGDPWQSRSCHHSDNGLSAVRINSIAKNLLKLVNNHDEIGGAARFRTGEVRMKTIYLKIYKVSELFASILISSPKIICEYTFELFSACKCFILLV